MNKIPINYLFRHPVGILPKAKFARTGSGKRRSAKHFDLVDPRRSSVSTKRRGDDRRSESGNVFLFVLMGVALFATLAITVSRGMRSQTTTTMSERDATLAAADILSYAQRIERGVARARRKNSSENDISFENNIVAGYTNAGCTNNRCLIFHASGGSANWQSPPSGANDGSAWIFTGSTCIADIGTGPTGCDGDTASNEELIMVLPNLDQTVCETINTKLGLSATLTDTGGGASATKFTGTFADGTEIIIGSSEDAACFSNGGFHFYSVLLER